MAQANSVQREPSMEEILASIRRIIEDSDTSRTALASQAGVAEDASHPASAEVVDVHAFRAEFRETFRDATDTPAESKPQQAVTEPTTQDEVATAVEEAPQAAALEQPETASPATEAFSASATLDAGAAADDDSADDALNHFADLLDDEMKRGIREETFETEMRPAIISDQTERQVAAAFGELSEAFASSRQKSFDEMAEAMLRPMLSDWLDNNLPPLVERLVREEIERIARGPVR